MELRAPRRDEMIAGTYRVVRALASGGMGIVVEVEHDKLGHRLALKMMRSDRVMTSEGLARFEREARIAAQLRSEHVARVHDFGRTETGEQYLAMELLEGSDLARVLKDRGPLPVETAVDYVLQACEALAEAHAAELVHRDIKPANLFLTNRPFGRPPIVKVLDFGLCKVHSDSRALTRKGGGIGTPEYMSPEQIRSPKDVDARSDQYAIAVVLFELLAGKPPFSGATAGAIAVAVTEEPTPSIRALRPDVPESVDRALLRAMAKARSERYRDLYELAEAIASCGGAGAAAHVEAIRLALSASRRIEGVSARGPDEAREHEGAIVLPVIHSPSSESLMPNMFHVKVAGGVSPADGAGEGEGTPPLAVIEVDPGLLQRSQDRPPEAVKRVGRVRAAALWAMVAAAVAIVVRVALHGSGLWRW